MRHFEPERLDLHRGRDEQRGARGKGARGQRAVRLMKAHRTHGIAGMMLDARSAGQTSNHRKLRQQ